MSYATLATLTDRFGEPMLVALTDRAQFPTGVVDAAVIARVIADVDGLIDGFLKRKYAWPLVEAQPLLVDVAGAIAIYKLHTSQADPKVVEDYKEAMKILDRISAGTIALTSAGVEAASVEGSGVQITDRERQLTQDNMTGFI